MNFAKKICLGKKRVDMLLFDDLLRFFFLNLTFGLTQFFWRLIVISFLGLSNPSTGD